MLIVGVMEVINLAHGSLFALGAYFAMMIIGLGASNGLDRWVNGMSDYPVGPALQLCPGTGPDTGRSGGYAARVFACAAPMVKTRLFGLLLTFGAAMVIEELIRVLLGVGRTGAANTRLRLAGLLSGTA